MKPSWIALAVLAAGLALIAASAPFQYELHALPLAEGVWMFEGSREYFTRTNGGDIANSGLIAAPDGAIVIDTGSSRRYGEALRAEVRRATGREVIAVYNTHAHPDHFLGNQAFSDVPIAALPGTIKAIQANGNALADNLYRLVGGWMQGTLPFTPTQAAKEGEVMVGGRKLRLIASSGHTDADLAIYDEATRTLFTGDLVFYQRTPATPNADLSHWLAALDALEAIDYRILVPGHGPAVRGPEAIAQTRDYLRWLRTSFADAAARGLTMPEVLQLPIPERFRTLAVADPEFQRTVAHLYPAVEQASLPAAAK